MPTDYVEQVDFFNANMRLLKKNHPHIWAVMKKNPPEPEGEIILATNGEPNLWTKDINGNNISLHVPENPGVEANDIFKIIKKDFTGTLIITGMGLGYCPLNVIGQSKSLRHLAVFEPNTGIFLQALKALDFSTLLSDPRVILGIGEDQNIAKIMEPAIKALQLEEIQHIKHEPSFALDNLKYNSLYENINNYISSANIEGNTFLKMGNDFFTNRLRHLNSVHHNYVFDDLKDKFKDMPAIIVSAGPSLDKNIHLLKKVKDKAVILAVDSALPSLITNEIMPNFITTIDPLELIFEKVAHVSKQVQDVSLICMSWASSKMAKLFPADNVFWCFGAKPIEQWMAKLVGCETITAGASSVAHLNFLSAIWMGCSPIILVGQDLSFSQSKSHASNMTLPTKDLINKTLKNEKDIIWLEGVHGKKVPSNRGFHYHKRNFETMIENQKGHYINSTEKGCHIEGTIVMPLQDSIEQFCTARIEIQKSFSAFSDKKDPAVLRNHLIRELQSKIKRCMQIKKWLKETKQLLNDLIKVSNKAEKSKTAYKSFNDLPSPSQKKLSKLDKIGKNLDDATDIWPIMQEITMAGLRHSEQQKHAIDQLSNNPGKYTKWLKRSLQRLDTVNEVRKEVLPLLQDTIEDDVKILQAEEKILTLLDKKENKEKYNQYLKKIITLYFDSGNINLAQPWLKELSLAMPDSGEADFFQGITSAHYTEYDIAEAFFAKAVKADPLFADRITKFRESQGDAYISYAPIFDINDKAVARRLLLKGLIYAPEHKKVKQELKLRSEQTITEIENHETEGTLSEAEDMIDSWLDDLGSIQKLAYIIGDDNASQLNYYKGVISVNKENFDLGIDHFNKALDITPNNPALHISLTDAYFAIEDYPKGINHLKQAVALDSVYAVYWEEIGDELMQSGQFEDALAAFENCFLILPERVHLLKKIGDCYQKTGQLEAAKEAYANLNALLKES
ncbi:MAG: DUF115 domain-containing protein [Desulfobacteraceae bacterium]|nr:DUF115 domain-containing protein [Desulfobacteraceae bacterium]